MRIIPHTGSQSQRATWWLCLLVWSQPLIVGYIVTVINKVTGISANFFNDYLLPAVYIVLALFSLPYISKRLRPGDWLFYFGFMAVFLGSYLLVDSNREYLSSLLTVIPFVMLPMYMLGVSFDVEPLKKQLYYISVSSILIQLLFFRLLTTTTLITSYSTHSHDHYQFLSYQVLPYVLYVIWFTFEKTNWVNLGISIIGSVLLLILGTRGPFMSLIVFVVVYLVVFKYPHIDAFQKILLLVVGLILYWSYTLIISQMMDVISVTGGSSRIVGWLLGTDSGAQLSSEARVDFAEMSFKALKDSNYMGLGFAGDRLFMEGFFVHNFFLECLVSYGVLFGVLIPLIVCYRLIKGTLRDINSDKCKFLLLLICIGMVPLLVSGSYVDDTWFYLMLGYCSQTLRMPQTKDLQNSVQL